MANEIVKIEYLEQAAKLFLKGFSIAEIARELDISRPVAKGYIDQYKEYIKDRANNDPDFLDRMAENTIEVLDEINMIKKETWQVFETAKNLDMVNHQTNTLKLLTEILEKQAKLLQLMGVKADSGNMARMNRAEAVNELVSNVIKEIISECPNCRQEAQIKLAEAFKIMNKGDDIVDAELVSE